MEADSNCRGQSDESHSQGQKLSHSKEDKECHHQTEKTHGLRQGKTQDGVGEKLLLERWIPAWDTRGKKKKKVKKNRSTLSGKQNKQTSYHQKPGLCHTVKKFWSTNQIYGRQPMAGMRKDRFT